ncbi:hypothetical protein PAPYR_5981 [Paratrimastix pyriformis]|uniref:Acid phosphatase n=1 Tax=Paratrimastix pyriformis TaxID=342808 RepID=A0ABQ8UIQ7_9EUKA|nr:hypothetical protein PAPYR_5981 [Paratrimastix pyriformis]
MYNQTQAIAGPLFVATFPRNDRFTRVSMGLFIRELLSNFKADVAHTADARKYRLYSAHDSTVMAYLAAVNHTLPGLGMTYLAAVNHTLPGLLWLVSTFPQGDSRAMWIWGRQNGGMETGRHPPGVIAASWRDTNTFLTASGQGVRVYLPGDSHIMVTRPALRGQRDFAAPIHGPTIDHPVLLNHPGCSGNECSLSQFTASLGALAAGDDWLTAVCGVAIPGAAPFSLWTILALAGCAVALVCCVALVICCLRYRRLAKAAGNGYQAVVASPSPVQA